VLESSRGVMVGHPPDTSELNEILLIKVVPEVAVPIRAQISGVIRAWACVHTSDGVCPIVDLSYVCHACMSA
jgi:hypothetical protein